MLLEDLKGIGEKADLVPHTRAFERDESDPFLGTDGLHLRPALGPLGAQQGAFDLRGLRGVYMEGNSVLPRRQNAAGVQDLRATGRDLLCLVIVKRSEQARGWSGARVR